MIKIQGIFAEQFKRLKTGDRFYYENGHQPSIGFTLSQLEEIRKFSFERFICNTVNVDKVQSDSLHIPHPVFNPFKLCENVPDLDFKKWKE